MIHRADNLVELLLRPSHRIDPVATNAHRPEAYDHHDGHHDDGDCLPRPLCPESVLRRGLFCLFLLSPLGFLSFCFFLLPGRTILQNRSVFAPPLLIFYSRMHIMYRSRLFVQNLTWNFLSFSSLALFSFASYKIDMKKKSQRNIPHKSAGFSRHPEA